MFTHRILTICAFFFPFSLAFSSYAACTGDEIFSCMTSEGKMIEVCRSQEGFEYSSGVENSKPEIAFSVPKSQVEPITDSDKGGDWGKLSWGIRIKNGKTVYEVYETLLARAGSSQVVVIVDGKETVWHSCDRVYASYLDQFYGNKSDDEKETDSGPTKDACPYSVSTRQVHNEMQGVLAGWMTVLRIESTDDSVTIKNLVINRGNVKIRSDIFPRTLKFAEHWDIIVGGADVNVRELVITSERGTCSLSNKP
jgi:hypothetical protein